MVGWPPGSFWVAPSQATIAAMSSLTTWATDPTRPYTTAAQHTFLSAADYFLVAEALAGGHIVVTREKSQPAAKRRVLIPDACAGLGVAYQDPFTVYETLGLKLL